MRENVESVTTSPRTFTCDAVRASVWRRSQRDYSSVSSVVSHHAHALAVVAVAHHVPHDHVNRRAAAVADADAVACNTAPAA